MFLYLNYYLLKQSINDIESKNKISANEEKLFLYSNLLNIPKFFRFKNLFSIKSYDMFLKIENQKTDLLISNMIDLVRKNKYNSSEVIIVYSLAIEALISFETSKLNLSESDEHILDIMLAKETDPFLDLNSLYTLYPSSFIMSFTELELFSESIRNTYFLPNVDRYLTLACEEFKDSFKHYPLRLCRFLFEDLFIRKRGIKHKDVVFKKHLALSKKKKGYYDELYSKLNETIYNLKGEIYKLNEALFQAINFDKKAEFVNFVSALGWDSYVNELKYIKGRKRSEKSLKGLIKLHRKNKRSK